MVSASTSPMPPSNFNKVGTYHGEIPSESCNGIGKKMFDLTQSKYRGKYYPFVLYLRIPDVLSYFSKIQR